MLMLRRVVVVIAVASSIVFILFLCGHSRQKASCRASSASSSSVRKRDAICSSFLRIVVYADNSASSLIFFCVSLLCITWYYVKCNIFFSFFLLGSCFLRIVRIKSDNLGHTAQCVRDYLILCCLCFRSRGICYLLHLPFRKGRS